LFRGHGRAWKLRLPWGWNTGDAGPKEMTGDWVAAWPREADLHRADVEVICRKYLNLRYQLLPYNYSSLVRTHETGVPLMRALCLGWPGDAKAVLIDDEYLWGESFLVAPVHEKDARSREVYLPAGDWWDYWSGARVAGAKSLTREVDLETMPLYVRAGAIVPMGPVRQHTGEVIEEPVTLRVYPGADGRFAWYDDDGSSYRHETGDFMRIECEWNDKERTLTLRSDGAGKMPVPAAVKVELVGEATSKLVTLNLGATTVKL
jgi:alpha-glucosidase/alpha-D-xyloside xylohydrolase